MHLTPISEIYVRQDRNRKQFSEQALRELAESIASTGLIHLPVVCKANGRYELLAGERRMRAMQLLWTANREFKYLQEPIPLGMFPYSLVEEVDTLTARAIELEENISRTDLTWQERITAIAAFHELRKVQNPRQRLQDTNVELGYAPHNTTSGVSEALLLAKNLSDPEIAKAKNVSDARKIMLKKFEREARAQIALCTNIPVSSKHKLEYGDMTKLMMSIPSGTVDVVLTDPPYGVDAETFRANMSTMHEYDDDWTSIEHLIQVLAAEGFRVTRQQAHAYVFCDVLMFILVRDIFDDAGWSVWPRPLIWVKDVGHIPNANLGPQRRYECILYANKGDRPVTALYPDVISCPAVNEKQHAAQKPVELYCNLLKRSIIPNDLVLDPFCGSGTIFEAAESCGCAAIGFENDEKSFALAKERILAL